MKSLLPALRFAFAALLLVVPAAAADDDGGAAPAQKHFRTPDEAEVNEKLPVGESLSGETIYDRFLENRRSLGTASQRGRILSKDPGGHDQEVRFWMIWKDYTDADDEPVNNVYDRWSLKMVPPADFEHTGYLYVHVDEGEDQEFMYSPHRGRTFRMRLKGQQVAGTDFSFDDFLLSLDDVEDASYKRHPDETLEGVEVYVVEAFPQGRYWNEAGVEAKVMTSPRETIRDFQGMWMATETTVRDLLEGTSSTLIVDEMVPNAALDDDDFAIAALQQRP
jgi:hypothetical protein